MAKIRLRMGSCEVEIESSDFYIDNKTVASVIDGMAKSLQGAAPQARLLTATATVAGTAEAGHGGRTVQDAGGTRPLPPTAAAASTAAAAPLPIKEEPAGGMPAPAPQGAVHPGWRASEPHPDLSSVLDGLDEAEVFEPEFDEPRRIPASEVAGRLKALAAGGFFGMRRTVTETVAEMAEHGWLAGPLDVSKALARMAMDREMRRESRGYMTCYCGPPDGLAGAAAAAAAGPDPAAAAEALAAACPPAPALS